MPGTKAPLGVAPYRRVKRAGLRALSTNIRTVGTSEKGPAPK